MGPFDRLRAPLYTALGMIGVPLVLAFIVGAGAGTVVEPISEFAGTLWSIFGVASLILGSVLLFFVGLAAWRNGSDEIAR
ncbi:MAG: hypothetical protein AAF943_01485 [Pseudomonadota bacterium]